jgi:hypothetical protein
MKVSPTVVGLRSIESASAPGAQTGRWGVAVQPSSPKGVVVDPLLMAPSSAQTGRWRRSAGEEIACWLVLYPPVLLSIG